MQITDTSDLPVGTIVMWGGVNNIPLGWLLCDGTVYQQKDYQALFGIISHNFGNDAPSGQFYVPDLRGRFVRGVDGGTRRDPDASSTSENPRKDMQSGLPCSQQIGSIQDQAFLSHKHDITITDPTNPVIISLNADNHGINSSGPWSCNSSPTIEAANNGGNETRPINAALYFIIKAE